MKCNRILILIMVIFIGITMNVTCFANDVETNEVTKDFELSIYASSNGEVEYGVYVEQDNEGRMTSISIKATDYNLPSNLYKYKDDIRLRIKYTEPDYEVLDCKVINYKTGEIIEDLSEENIDKLFNIEYGKSIIEKSWVDTIKLSELKENEIYKYTADSTLQFPKIENDVGKNCVIYIKEWQDEGYGKEISMNKEISGSRISVSFNEYNSGEAFNIMYKKVENDELLKLIQQDDIIYLSKYNDGDELEYKFEEYIYNDTERNITIHTKSTDFGVEKSDSITMEKGEIYGFDWSISSASISYSENNNNEEPAEKEEEKNNGGEQETTEQAKGDDTQINEKIPQAGESIRIIVAMLLVTIIAIISYKKVNRLKDIK